ncbi:TonB-dependent receptor [Chitinophaga sp. RCC_12]|uniref:TonB-dependent receptor n=1 Tax=Chitinophaga sp. RCC_12 TaxID=3239226 RepID=UPI0035241639
MKRNAHALKKAGLLSWETLRLVKLSFSLVIFLSLQVSAVTYAQRVNLSEKQTPLREVFKEIKKQTGYNFLLNTEMLADARPVTLTLVNATLEEALNKCFEGQPFTYTINNNTIVVKRKAMPVVAAQEITGTVTDEKGVPVPGARILNQSTNKGAITNDKGEFRIAVNPGEKLSIKMLGYEEIIITADSKQDYNIRLKPSTVGLDAVVVVGYGTQKKANLTGAVSMVSSDDFKGRPATSAVSALQGQMTGVTVVNATAIPGGSDQNTIRIRGIGTLNDAGPLVVVDGIPGGNLNILNPDDIETVSVLKDAASSSIYGVRGANGVILVTTKKGKSGKPSLTYANYFGVQTPTALPTFLGSADYMTLLNEAKVNAGNNPTYTQEQIDIAKNGSDLNYYANTNWLDEMYKSGAPQQNHMLNLSGGANNINYYLSYGFLKQGGLITGDNYNAKRHNVRLRLNTTLFDILQLDANIGYIDRNQTGSSLDVSGTGGPIQSAHQISPLVPVRFTTGGWGYLGGSQNPVAVVTDGGTNDFSSQEITGNIQATLNITKDFRLRGQYGLVKSNSFRQIFTKTINYYSPEDNSLIYQTNNPNKIDNRDYTSLYQTVIGMAEYEKTFAGKHYVKALAAASSEETVSRNFTASRTNLPTQDLGSINLGTLNPLNGSDGSQNALQSIFGRVNYAYSDKYLLEGNFRYDGSTRFAADLRWNWFFSGSAGWVFSKEPFFKSLEGIINFGKIRASYGTQGNDKVQDDFGYLSSISSVATMPIGNVLTLGYRQTGIPNPLLTWESMTKQDIGLDLTFLSNRLSLTADYYINNTNDILLRVPLPDVLGIGTTNYPYQNAGKVRNKGWELMVGWQDRIGDISYGVSGNLSDVKNEVISLGNAPATLDDRIRTVGQPIDAFYGFVADRISQISDYSYDAATNKYTPLFPYDASYPMMPGDIIYKDLNNDKKITAADDRQVIGSAIPRYTYGFKGNIEYKGVDFSFFLQGVGKADGWITSAARHAFINDGSNPQPIHLDRWTPQNPGASYPRLAYGYSYNQRLSTFWLEDASYLRLKNIQVGYTLPARLTEKLRIDRFRLYFSADNLFTASDFFYGYDPETPVSSGGFYPQVKTFVFGLNINFK